MEKQIKRLHSKETKEHLSKKRKEWLKNNPDKHPWRNKDKFQSKPCEKVKEYLKSKNILFIEEYDPKILNRFFSIDIAMPEKMIALEINGNQHYEKDGSLKPYYQERHDLLESNGWKVFEIHYSHCFHLEKWDDLLNILLNTDILIQFDYIKYLNGDDNKREKSKNINFCNCGNPIDRKAKSCAPCYNLERRKVKERPTKEKLLSLISQMSMVKIGKLYGVSDNCIRKWLK